MQPVPGLQVNSKQTTTKDICSRHGMLRAHVCSSAAFTPGTNQQAQQQQHQQQRPHAVLQRCHSLLVRQSAPGSGAATQQQQLLQQQQVLIQPDVPQQLQAQQPQQWQQEQLLQERSQLLPLQDEAPSQPGTSGDSCSGSRSSEGSHRTSSNGATAAAVAAAAAAAVAEALRPPAGAAAVAGVNGDAVHASADLSSSQSVASSSGRDLQADASPASITWSIRHADSIERLSVVVGLYGPVLNCIHISAAFVQLQRLWPSQLGSAQDALIAGSSSGSSIAAASGDDWLSSSSSSSSGDALTPARLLLSRLQSLALSVPRVDGRFVANVAHSLGVLQSVHGQRGAYNAALVNRLCAAAYSLANSMPPQELATLAWSLARLSVVPAPSLLRRLASNLLWQQEQLNAQDLLMALTALPALHQTPGVVAPYATVHKLADRAGRVLPAASAHETAGLLAALGALQWVAPPAWLQGYWAAAAPKLAGMGWEQLGMTGWGLGQLTPLSAGPDAAWMAAWEGAVQQQLAAAMANSSSSSSGVPLVELVMVLYGWSKAMPQQPPSQELQQLVLAATQAAMAGGSSSSSSLSLQQQQHHHQQQQSLRSPGWQQQQHSAHQQQQQPTHSMNVSSSSTQQGQPELNPRLLGDLVSAMARWQLLPPRQWLLVFLSAVQQHMLCGSYSTRDLSSTLWGLATLGVRPKTPWLDLAAAAAEQQMQVQAEGVTRLQQQRRTKQQQQTREWAAAQQRRKGAVSLSPSETAAAAAVVAAAAEPAPVLVSSLDRPTPHPQSQQQQQQYAAVPKQTAVLLWSLLQLQYTPSSSFWQQYWSLTAPLLPGQYNARDLAMTLEAVHQHQQQPPQQWVKAALLAGASVHMREQLAPDTPQQQQQQSRAPDSSSSSSSSRIHQRQRQQERRAPSGPQLQQQQRFSRDVLRMLCGFARLGVAPGHSWCAAVLERSVRPLLGCLTPQDLCQLLWALGACGYSPPGRALPPWLHSHLTATLTPGQTSSSSSSNSSSGSSSSSGALLFPGLGAGSTLQLLVGLRRCQVVVGGSWLAGLMATSEMCAAELPPQVYTRLLAYLASTGVNPPPSWASAVAAALPVMLEAQQQQQQEQSLVVWLLSLVGSLRSLRVRLQPQQLAQLQQAAAAAQAGDAEPAGSKRLQSLLAALQRQQQKHEEQE